MSKPRKNSKSSKTGLPPAIRPSKEATDKFWDGVFQKLGERMPSAFSRRTNHLPAKAEAPNQFPKYLMKVNGQRKFFTFSEAVVVYDSGSCKVSFGQYILHADFSVEKMTDADKAMISEGADRYSAGK